MISDAIMKSMKKLAKHKSNRSIVEVIDTADRFLNMNRRQHYMKTGEDVLPDVVKESIDVDELAEWYADNVHLITAWTATGFPVFNPMSKEQFHEEWDEI